VIDARTWKRPAIFDWLQDGGNVADDEMYRTFNCGIGMVLAVNPKDAEATLKLLIQAGESAFSLATSSTPGRGGSRHPRMSGAPARL